MIRCIDYIKIVLIVKYIYKARDGKLWYELEDDIKKSKNRTLMRYFKKYDEARLKLQNAGAMLTRAFDLEKR